MKKALVVVAMLALCASSARAVVINESKLQARPTDLTAVTIEESSVRTATDGVLRYDNWTNPGSNLVGIFTVGTHEIADDVNMIPLGGTTLLDTMGFNVANSNCTTGNMTGGVMIIRFYDSAGNPILDSGGFFGFTSTLPALNLAAGGSSRLSFAGGALETLGYQLPDSIFVSLQEQSLTWSSPSCTAANFGLQLRAPIVVGSSSDQMQDVTAGQAFNFGGSPLANTGIKMVMDPAPEPATLSLLAMGAFGLIRRRK